ncbi:MAG: type II secretion system protein [bacterium]|nr:type II secretion system protein [bacterium]
MCNSTKPVCKTGGFTLAEVLITLAIIGVVAAVSIPSVISNSQQQEFKTGLRKAVSVLNSAITMNMALDGETPYDNSNLMGYLMKHMSVMASTTDVQSRYSTSDEDGTGGWNAAFYTTDGMRFEFRAGPTQISSHKLHESDIYACQKNVAGRLDNPFGKDFSESGCGGCGAMGLKNNADNTTKPPCIIMVDVNGDRKPNPQNADCKHYSCYTGYKYSDPKGKRLTDLFTIIITDKQAIPYGTASQKAMYDGKN